MSPIIVVLRFMSVLFFSVSCLSISAAEDAEVDPQNWRLSFDSESLEFSTDPDPSAECVIKFKIESPCLKAVSYRLVNLEIAKAKNGDDLLLPAGVNNMAIDSVKNNPLNISIKYQDAVAFGIAQLKGVLEVTFVRKQYELNVKLDGSMNHKFIHVPAHESFAVQIRQEMRRRMATVLCNKGEGHYMRSLQLVDKKQKDLIAQANDSLQDRLSTYKVSNPRRSLLKVMFDGDVVRVQYPFDIKDIVYPPTEQRYESFKLTCVVAPEDESLVKKLSKKMKKFKVEIVKPEPYLEAIEDFIKQAPAIETRKYFLSTRNEPRTAMETFDVFDPISLSYQHVDNQDSNRYYVHQGTRMDGKLVDPWSLGSVFKNNSLLYFKEHRSDEGSVHSWDMNLGPYHFFSHEPGKHSLDLVLQEAVATTRNQLPGRFYSQMIPYEIVVSDESKAAYEFLKNEGCLFFFTNFFCIKCKLTPKIKTRYLKKLNECMADKEMSTQRLRRAVEERCRFLLRQSVLRGPSGDTSSGIYSTISNAYDKGELLQVIAILGMCNPKAIYEDLNFKSDFFRRGHRNSGNVRKYLT
ncbi:MAG: hypothetical protein HRU15_06300, partial [Planctomycetes bacterium]|nr:hypothetical protein [Planctomycetota bacterium]